MGLGICIHLDLVVAEPTFLVRERAINQLFQLLDGQGIQLKDLRPRNKRAVDVEKWIVGGRTDQSKVSGFNIWQQNVLLRFVEVMDLIDKQNRLLPGSPNPVYRRGKRTPHLGDVAF